MSQETVKSKLDQIITSKAAIRSALQNKTGSDPGEVLADYPSVIDTLSSEIVIDTENVYDYVDGTSIRTNPDLHPVGYQEIEHCVLYNRSFEKQKECWALAEITEIENGNATWEIQETFGDIEDLNTLLNAQDTKISELEEALRNKTQGVAILNVINGEVQDNILILDEESE